MIRDIARAKSAWQFVLIGPVWEGALENRLIAELRALKNISMPGHIPYEQLPTYLYEADALVIPYVLNDATRAVFPLKLFEYLATGKPVVASQLPSLRPYEGAVRLADSKDEWIAALEASLRDPHEMEDQRRRLAKRHTWEGRLRKMEKQIAPLL